MKNPPRPQSSSRWHSLLVLLLLLTGMLWWALRTGPAPGGPPGGDDRTSAKYAQAKSSDRGEAGRDAKTGARKAPDVELADIVEPPSSLERGENNVLVFERPRQVERQVTAGRIFGEDILRVRDGAVRGPLTLDKHTTSAVEAAYDPTVVQRFVESDTEAIRLPLDGERSALVKIERVLSRGPVTHTLIGKVHHEPLSDVLMVFHDGAISGSVSYYGEGDHYQFGMAGNGDIAIRKLDPSTYTAPCGNPGAPPQPAAMADQAGAPPEPPELPEVPVATADVVESDQPESASVVLDTVIGYDKAASALIGVPAMEALIMESVDRMNLAFTNSLVADTEVVLLATVEDPDYVYPGGTSGSMGSGDELGDLDDSSAGNPSLNTVSDLRIALGADHNGFVLKDVDGSAGIAYRPFSPGPSTTTNSMIVARTYMTPTRLTFAHEFAHNLGCQHAWGDNNPATSTMSVDEHHYGWRLDPPGGGASGTRVRTIMAYDWNWGNGDRIPYYSNPDVQYNGAKTGAADGHNATGDATADSRSVSGGYYGGWGAGYDGSNANLGARNADFIEANAQYMADNADRPAPEIEVEQPVGFGLTDEVSSVDINAPSLDATGVKTFTIRNTGDADLTGLLVTKDGSEAGDFIIGALGATTLAPGASTTFDVTFDPSAVGPQAASLHIASNDDDENPFEIDLVGRVRVEVNNESFETGFGVWTQLVGAEDDFDWTENSGGTLSSSTGPSGAADGGSYVYTEASSPNNPGKTAGMEATFDFSGLSDMVMIFSYHMYGSNMGTLSVDVYNGSWNLDVWSRTGQQHTSDSAAWSTAMLDLSAYDGTSGVIVRFRGVTGGGFRSDMALDAVEIYGEPASYDLNYTAGPGGTLSGSTSQSVPSGGDGTVVTADANTNYHFVDWSDGSTANPRTDTNVMANISVTANFAIDTYTVTFQEGAHGAITAGQAVQTVDHGSAAVAPTITADPGWDFSTWDVAFNNVMAPLTVTAQYTQITHQLTVASAHGTPSPAVGGHPYNWGTELTPTVTSPDEQGTTRYVCSGWTGTGSVTASGSGTSTTFTLTEDSSITWNWDTEYQLDVETSGSGSVDVGDGWHAPASQVVLTATATAGNHFTGWTGDTGAIVTGDALSAQITVQLGAPVALTAGFANGVKYDDWASAAGLAGNDALLSAIPFGDGVTNFHKYAFNMNGSGPDSGLLVPGTGTTGLPSVTRDTSGPAPVIRLEYLQRKIAGMTYVPQQQANTLDGGSWVAMTGTVTVTSIDAEWDRVQVEHPEATVAAEYFRVSVTMD